MAPESEWKEEDGWRLVRTRDSHRQYKNLNNQGTVTVAGEPSPDGPTGALNAILEQAGQRKAGGDGWSGSWSSSSEGI